MTTITHDGNKEFTGIIPVPIATMSGHALSLNSRVHYMAKAAATKKWRAFAATMAARYPELGTCDVTLTWFVKDSRRRDEDNMFPLLKALCDGLVDAGVVRDDTPDLMGKACRIERAPKGAERAYMELKVASRLHRVEQP